MNPVPTTTTMTREDTTAYSVVIPVYNSSESLKELHKGITEVLERLRADFEIIFVDDASKDERTWPTLERLQADDPRVVAIRLMKNSGQHNATLCGLRHARGALVFTLDDDLQHFPGEMPKLIDHLRNRPTCDAVFARPMQREHATSRNVGSYFANRLVRHAIRAPRDLTFSSYRLLRRHLVHAICCYSGSIVTLGSLICQTSDRVENVDVLHGARKFGDSNYSTAKLISLAVANVFNFSDLPLKMISAVGFLSSAFALVYSLWVLTLKMTGASVQPGFPTLVLLISFFSGMILFSFGVVGQYLIRILRGVTGGTQYQIRECLGREAVAPVP